MAESQDEYPAEAVSRAFDLATAYHASARAEIIQRLGYRDTALALFLAIIGVIGGIVFGGDKGLTDQSAPVLYIIPLLGLGATLIHVHHNGVIGALGVYLGVELHRELRRLFSLQFRVDNEPVFPPHDWDSSVTLRTTRRRPSQRRLIAGMMLLELPQVSALTISGIALGVTSISVLGTLVGVLASATTAWMLIASDHDRRDNAAIIRQYHSPFGVN